jgi:predicted nucleotide-binding protein
MAMNEEKSGLVMVLQRIPLPACAWVPCKREFALMPRAGRDDDDRRTFHERSALAKLREQIESARSMLETPPIDADRLEAWERRTKWIVESVYGPESPAIQRFGQPPVTATGANAAWGHSQRSARLQKHVRHLEALVEAIPPPASAALQEPRRSEYASDDRVFLVHGHADGVVNEVARFLEGLKLEVIVLREQPNLSKTIIEKFEEYADVRFAVVLLYGDDRGGLAAEPPEAYRPRARQNVVFELGYFIGRLGRDRVCALHAPGVELPSDYAGVGCVSLDDSTGWRLALARELKAAALRIDVDAALSRES